MPVKGIYRQARGDRHTVGWTDRRIFVPNFFAFYRALSHFGAPSQKRFDVAKFDIDLSEIGENVCLILWVPSRFLASKNRQLKIFHL